MKPKIKKQQKNNINKGSNGTEPINEQISQDIPEYDKLINQLNLTIQNLQRNMNFDWYLQNDIQQEEPCISDFLKARNALLAESMALLAMHTYYRLENGQFSEQLALDLIKRKILIQKMGNIYGKLEYQIKKQIQMATDENNPENEQDASKFGFRPRPELLNTENYQDEYQEDNQEDEKNTVTQNPQNLQDKKYKPLKLQSILPADERKQSKEEKKNGKKKRIFKKKIYLTFRLSNSLKIIQQINKENQDAPEMIDEDEYNERYIGRAETKQEKLKALEEEGTFHRMAETKKEKRQRTKMPGQERLDDFQEIGHINNYLKMEGLAENKTDSQARDKFKKTKGKKIKKLKGKKTFKKKKKRN